MKIVFTFLLCLNVCVAVGQNPISPEGLYMADPSGHVWADGKLYIYGSIDKKRNDFCSHEYYVLSSENLKTWNVSKKAFASKGGCDQIAYNDNVLFAPDCISHNGEYYLYYCQPGYEAAGVAVSQCPEGPFKKASLFDLGRYNEIDPSVFIDDDGQAYYIWGQFSAKIAKLKPGMREIDFSTLKTDIVTEKEHFFHEGGFMAKRNGIYYFIYSHMGRSHKPTCLGYATSLSPMGPFKYQGVIIDNDNCDPSNWNNHGSIVEFKGRWYVLYHRATHNSYSMRKACIEPITFNEDGTINEVEMTSQGASGPLDALSKLEAERGCLFLGKAYIDSFEENGRKEKIVNFISGDKIAYKYLRFNSKIKEVELRIKPGSKEGCLEMCLGQPWNTSFTKVRIPAKKNNDWIIVKEKVALSDCVDALWLKYSGEGMDMIEIDWLRFN